MRTKMEDLQLDDWDKFASPLDVIRPRKLNHEWDYVSSPIVPVGSWNKDNINPNNPSLLLKSANLDFEQSFSNHDQKDRQSSQTKILGSTEGSSEEEFFTNYKGNLNPEFADWWAAPSKQIKMTKHKEILKTIDK